MKYFLYGFKLIGEFIKFAFERKIYWLIPLMFLLIPAALFFITGEAAAPLIYTLF